VMAMVVRFDVPDVLDELVEDFLTPDFGITATPFPAIDIIEKENEAVVVAEVPGVKKEDVSIKFENNTLTISGTRKPYEIPNNSRVLLNEMRVQNFSRSISFEYDVEADKISAELNNGVLRVTLPKAETARTRTIEIK